MKCISVKSPWWEKILSGEKTIEVRSWDTRYRGDLLICSTANPKAGKDGVDERFKVGRTICVAKLIAVRRYKPGDYEKSGKVLFDGSGQYAWVLANVRPVVRYAVKGQQRVFERYVQLEFLKDQPPIEEPSILLRNDWNDEMERRRAFRESLEKLDDLKETP
jgi:hypothetical protein